MEHPVSFGEWLTLFRQTRGLPRAELATRIGCAVVTLRKIEADERRPSRPMAEQLADQLAIPARWREVFVRVARGELPVARLPLPQAEAAGPTNLPSPTTPLAGRTREVGEVAALLSRPHLRLLTLTGAPGVGKTRLALEAAATVTNAFPGGVFFVPLAPLTDPGLVLVAVAHALHVGTAGAQPLAERLGRYLRPRQVLLVLDNFEHMLPAAPHLNELLAAAPHLKLLVTSRIALELSGEHRLTVLPLAVPPPAGNTRQPLTPVLAQERYPAVELFLQRAQAVNPDLVATEATVRAVGEITRRLDGLPLAIEFAAARVALFTPQELLTRLDDRFAILAGGARDLPARHMTLARAIDWSYSLLAPAEQHLFRRLSVFADGCTLEAALAVGNHDGALGPDALGALTALVAGSLLQRRAGEDGASRFDMLETVRAFALGQLRASGEAETIQLWHARYYLELAAAAEQAWDGPEEAGWLRRLVEERDNLRAVLRWSLDTPDAEVALRLNAALFSFWNTCSVLSEARRWLEAALELPRPEMPAELAAVEAKVWSVAGYIAAAMRDDGPACAHFARGLALYRALGDRRGTAWSLRGRAFVHMLRGEFAAAAEQGQESRQLCAASGDDWGLAWSLYSIAFVQLARGDLAQARPALEEALAHLRRQNIPFGVFRALVALGYTQFEQGDIARAEELYREGLGLARETPMLTFVTAGVEGLGMVAAAQGKPGRAARLWGAADALREATDERGWPVFQRSYEQARTAVRAQLPPAEWAAAWAAGRALTAAQAVAEALEDAAPSAGLEPHPVQL